MRNPFRKQLPSDPTRPRGVVRVDARTKKLTKRLQPGQIAVIDHMDLDRVAAEALVECQPAAVLNAAPSVSGRYPNLGPGILIDAGIPLIDDLGPDVMRLREGQRVVIERLATDWDSDSTLAPTTRSAATGGDGEGTDHGEEEPTSSPTPTTTDGESKDEASSGVGHEESQPETRVSRRARRARERAVPMAAIRVEDSGEIVAQGRWQDENTVAASMEEAKAGLSVQLEAFAANTMEYMKGERDLLLNGVGMPRVRTTMNGRHVLVVVRGYSYKEDLRALKPYVRDYKPVLIGVDGGADAILEAGMKPDMIVGDMDSVSDKALSCGAEIIVHAYRDGRAPGLARVEELGVDHEVFAATGTSEDIAMLIADAAGAELIVAVGTHATLTEFLDKGRAGMSSTFLTRLKVGSRLIDAKGVSRLYRTRISGWQLALLALAGLIALFAALAATPAGQTLLGLSGAAGDDLINFFRSLLGLAPSSPSV